MYKNLSPKALGISGRQSELIELALTYGFRGMDTDLADLAKRAKVHGVPQAIRFLESAKIKVGGFDLPVNLKADDTTFRTQVTQLSEICEVARALKATRCLVLLSPYSDDKPFQANFEMHRQRLAQIGELLGQNGIRLGVGFQALASAREGKQHQFTHQPEALLTLLKTVGVKTVGLLLDTWNWFVGGGGLDQIRELSPEQIIGVRIADFPLDANAARIADTDRHLPLEGGTVDCSAVVTALAKKQYAGPVTLYPHPTSLRGSTRESIVQRTAQTLEELWKAAGLSKIKPPSGSVAAEEEEPKIGREEAARASTR